ncbi:hypothetical protein C2857_000730 [Epichloe festucae Fl1]|uniref:Uncharacterized protein n=1 Tax=Epichloe festucae (strain Fl1) TaxID=877507 RepID=A0A7S9KRB3_EPIFF|nr:hypothetical protein C2857_000730 [Epichloe festucae Fl1]
MQLDLIMPLDKFLAIPSELIRSRQQPIYYRMTGSMGQLLHEERLFDLLRTGLSKPTICLLAFNTWADTYIRRRGNNVFSMLHIDVYQVQCKQWYDIFCSPKIPILTQDLRQREKLVRACHSISTEELTWLLCDNTGSSLALDLKNDLNAKECTAEQDFYQGTTSSPSALSASPSSWSEASRKDKEEIGLYLYEWLSLFRLESPRVQSGDKVDTYLSRYQVTSCEHEQVDICKISWSGLIGTNWFQDLIRDVLAVRPAEGWISISASSFCDVGSRPGSELMILRSPTKEGQYLMWRLQCSI